MEHSLSCEMHYEATGLQRGVNLHTFIAQCWRVITPGQDKKKDEKAKDKQKQEKKKKKRKEPWQQES